MSRREFPKKVRIAAWDRCGGLCEGESCGLKLMPHRFHYDHDLADGLGGEPTLENCRVLCTLCHDIKTRTHDVPLIAKGKRIREKHLGQRPPSRRPLTSLVWKRTVDGRTVRRD